MVWRGICVCKNYEGKETKFLLKYAQERKPSLWEINQVFFVFVFFGTVDKKFKRRAKIRESGCL